MIEVDGSKGEGGGQMLRTALALSALTGQETRVFDIRAGRPNPGMQAQHKCAVEGVARICGAEVRGAEVGSTELRFSPGKVRGGSYRLSVGTAGSITLVLQACLLASARCPDPMRFEISGGTNVRWSPPIDFYQGVLFPQLQRLGLDVELREMRRGFYPEGGGSATVTSLAPERMLPMENLDRGPLHGIEGRAFAQNLPEHIPQRMGAAARKTFLMEKVKIASERSQGASAGAGIFLMAVFQDVLISGDALGERGVPAERVGEAASEVLRQEMVSSSTIDAHAADQLLPYMALAEGRSRFIVKEITGHLSTQVELLRLFLGSRVDFEQVSKGAKVEVRPHPYM